MPAVATVLCFRARVAEAQAWRTRSVGAPIFLHRNSPSGSHPKVLATGALKASAVQTHQPSPFPASTATRCGRRGGLRD